MVCYQRIGLLSLLAVFFLIACDTHAGGKGKMDMGSADAMETVMRVNHYMIPCEGAGPQLCLLVQMGDKVGSDEWEFFYDAIEGFDDYRLGYIYELVVTTEQVKRPPQDASSIVYKLVKVRSKNRVKPDTSFVLPLTRIPGESYVTGSEQAGFALLDRIHIACAAPLCRQLAQRMATGESLQGTFKHSDRADDTIVLLALSQ